MALYSQYLDTFPSGTETDVNFVYASLGSFWNQIFQDKQVLRGYCKTWADLSIQKYIDLIETINSFSVYDIPVFHTEQWVPLTILKSQFTPVPFLFEPDQAVFGPQPSTDTYFPNVTFEWGEPKDPNAHVYAFQLSNSTENITQTAVIANRILAPSFVSVQGNGFIIKNGYIHIRENLFNNPTIPVLNVTDENGNVIDQQIIMWLYTSGVDTQLLYNNWGTIFEYTQTSSQGYKDMLEDILALFVSGPNIKNIQALVCSFLGIPTIIEPYETIQEIYATNYNSYVVTDQNAYIIPIKYTLLSSLTVGQQLMAGDLLVTNVAYYDNVKSKSWWLTQIKPYLGLSSYVFLANVTGQLLFKNGFEMLSIDSDNNVIFPVIGTASDVQAFQDMINTPDFITGVNAQYGTNLAIGSPITINPVDFIFRNVIANNTAMISFSDLSPEDATTVSSLLYLLLPHLPPYVYFIYQLDVDVPNDLYDELNDSVTFPDLTSPYNVTIFNSDASDIVTGNIASLAPMYYKNVDERGFSIGTEPKGITNLNVLCNTNTAVDLAVQPGALYRTVVSDVAIKLEFLNFS